MSGKPIDEAVVERVARAIAEVNNVDPIHWKAYRPEAEAALTAAQQQGQAVACDACGGSGEMEVQMRINDVENDTTMIGCDACDGSGLRAAPPTSVPEGWVLVPVEPTEAMWQSGKHFCDGHVTRTIQTYRAMIAAAPSAQEPPHV